MFHEALSQFVQRTPVCVAVHAVVHRMLAPAALNDLFRRTARAQYSATLLFSTVVDLVGRVIGGQCRSVHEAYLQTRDVGVSVTAVYDKINGLEPDVSRALVRHSAAEALAVAQHLTPAAEPLAGYELRIVDGNHLAGTEHRLAELRHTRSGALPGQALVVLDPRRKLIVDAVPCEDGHAQERSLVPQLLGLVQAGELWMADRNFCTTKMLTGVVGRRACFLVRQHASALTWEEAGPWRDCGRCGSGRVREQPVRVLDPQADQWLTVRRVELTLDEPTRDGERVIVLLSNLPPASAAAAKAADLYAGRWQVEGVFLELTTALRCEVRTLGHPKAALLAFCVALTAYNAVSLVKSALAAAHGQERVDKEVSFHQMAREVATTGRGMEVAVPAAAWAVLLGMSPQEFAGAVTALLQGTDLRRYKKHVRGPKKPRPLRTHGKRDKHVSTARLIAFRATNLSGP